MRPSMGIYKLAYEKSKGPEHHAGQDNCLFVLIHMSNN